ncbi:MAG TPA: hypothetical protein VI854_01890 [Acidimicrobiia bacterium]|nr:hypothetical protein [Acidimicrobiia bacterium]
MDAAILVAVVVGFTANLVATVGFSLQLSSRFDRLFEKLEEHVLDRDRHVS